MSKILRSYDDDLIGHWNEVYWQHRTALWCQRLLNRIQSYQNVFEID